MLLPAVDEGSSLSPSLLTPGLVLLLDLGILVTILSCPIGL